LLPSGDADRIQRPANHVIAHARQVLHAAAANQHNRVLLQVVSNPRDVCGHFNPVGQPDTRHLA